MANRHILQLEFPPTSNESVFLVNDISIYATGLPISCAELQILPPGYGVPTVIGNLNPPFNLVLNACTIGMLPPTGCATSCPGLPDGIYHVRYDVSPNSIVFVEYDVMRITHATNLLMELLCKLNLQNCLPDSEIQEQLTQLDFIKWLLLSAKVTVEDQHVPGTGIAQYRYALSLIDKMSTRRCFR